MNKPQIRDYKDLFSYDTLRYIETFFQYCRHIQYYFDEKLTDSELSDVRALQDFIGNFLKELKYQKFGSPYKEFYSRYQRLYNNYSRLELW